LTDIANRCTCGPENLSPTPQKDFCNNIDPLPTSWEKGGVSNAQLRRLMID
jgi:hypothetical protein